MLFKLSNTYYLRSIKYICTNYFLHYSLRSRSQRDCRASIYAEEINIFPFSQN